MEQIMEPPRTRVFIRQPEKKIIGQKIEDIVGAIIDRTIEPVMISDDFDKETFNIAFEIKGCRMFNNFKCRGKSTDSKGKFIIPVVQLEEFLDKCKRKGKIGVYWFVLYFDEPSAGNMVHCWIKAEDMKGLIGKRKGNTSIYWDWVFRKGLPIQRLQNFSNM